MFRLLLFLFSYLTIEVFCGKVVLSPRYTLEWNIDTDKSVINFSLNVSTIAWVGIGFHPVGSASDEAMVNADAIITAFDSSGVATVGDYFSSTFTKPSLDTTLPGGTDDVLSPFVNIGTSSLFITFSRKLVTGDQWDTPITIGPMKVIWAIGTSTALSYHGYDPNNRGSSIVDFFENDQCGPTVGCQSCVALPQCIFCDSDNLCYDKSNTGKCSSLNSTCGSTCTNGLPNSWVPIGYCAREWASGLSSPRGIITASNNDLLVVEASTNTITVFWEDESGVVQKSTLATALGINHGIAIHEGYLYASNSTTVYRWKYSPGMRSDLGSPQIVVVNIPCCHHVTRTLIFDKNGLLYVSSGSGSNVDPNSLHARIKRFSLSSLLQPINWDDGELFADGLRNEVGIDFDAEGRLWGVENGCDDLYRPDLGGDIHTNNPSEEVNLFDEVGKFYGYPYCWTEYDLPIYGKGRGTQWVHPNFINDGLHSDSWCRDTSNVVVPRYNMLAHQAPLGIKFYNNNSFPGFPAGGAFVALHGSWDRQPPAGYRVIYLTFENGLPVNETVVLRHDGTDQNWPNNVRPVNISFKPCRSLTDCIYVTSDTSGQIIEISHDSTTPSP